MSEEASTPVPSEPGQQGALPAAVDAGLPPMPGVEVPPAPVENPPAAETPAASEPAPTPEPVAEHPEPEAEPAADEAAAEEAPAEETKDDNKHWYVVKVQSGREESIK